MRTLSCELVFDRNQAILCTAAPRDIQVVTDMGKEHDIDIFEHPGTNVIGFGSHKLFGCTWPDLDCAFKVFALHQLLHCDSSNEIERFARVVPFTVTRCTTMI